MKRDYSDVYDRMITINRKLESLIKVVDGLAEAMRTALGDRPAARAMAEKGRELFTSQFQAETMVQRIVEVYEEELAAGN